MCYNCGPHPVMINQRLSTYVLSHLHVYTSVTLYRWGILLAVCAIVGAPTFVFKFTPPPVLGTGNDTSPEWWPVTEGVSVVDLLLFFFSTVIQVSFNAYSMIAVLFNDISVFPPG